MHNARHHLSAAVAAVLAVPLALYAAGSAAATTSPDAEPAPRLVVADSASGSVVVLDSATGAELGSFEATGPARLRTDGHFAFAVDHDGNTVTILDGGIGEEAHGDHSHPVAEEPSVVGVLEGPEPAHIVTSGGYTAVFYDGAGRADVFPAGSFGDGEPTPELSVETGPHHGVAAVVENHVLVTIPGATAEDLPIGIEVRSPEGAALGSFPECPELHGEAVFDDRALFACADGVLSVATDGATWEAAKLPYPTGATSQVRAWSLGHAEGETLLSGVIGEQAVMLLDATSGESTVTQLDAMVLATAVTDNGAVALTVDGELHVLDAAGAVVSHGPVVEATPPDESAEDAPMPAIAVVDSTVFVSDPAGAVVAVPLDDAIDAASRWSLDFSPGAMVAVGS